MQLDAAAPILAKLKQPIIIAKLNADKYSRLARKLEIEYVLEYRTVNQIVGLVIGLVWFSNVLTELESLQFYSLVGKMALKSIYLPS